MKAILVIDEPKNCSECRVVDYWERPGEYHCRYLENRYMKKYNEKPIDCPLRPLPKRKRKIKEFPQYTKEYEAYCKGEVDGWNFLLDEILGEEE